MNTQTPLFFTATSGTPVTINQARAITVYTATAATNVATPNQSINIPTGTTLNLVADSGNTLGVIVVTPIGGATAYITTLGGSATQ